MVGLGIYPGRVQSLGLFLWVRMESNHGPLSYQESVLPLNYAPNFPISEELGALPQNFLYPSSDYIGFVIRKAFYHINFGELISLTSLDRSYYSRVARGVIELSAQMRELYRRWEFEARLGE